MNKILNISVWVLTVILIIVALGFANKSKQQAVMLKPEINIDYETDHRFISEADVLSQIITAKDTGSLLLNRFNVNHIEEKLKNSANK